MDRAEAVQTFGKALDRLKDALSQPETELIRDAAIKRFEFTFELAWKAIQRCLREEGITCRSPKGCLREAFAFGLIPDDPQWIMMIEDRNLTSHTYEEETAKRIFVNLKGYVPVLEQLHSRLSKLAATS